MNIDFSTILDLKVNKENVKMIEKEINKINNDIFDISLKDCANCHVGCVKETAGKSLKIETWGHGEINSKIGIRLRFNFYYSKSDKVDIENIENCTIKVNDLKVDMKMSQDFRFKGYIEYTIYIPYNHKIFTREYDEILDLEQPSECEQFCDELSELRGKVEEGIEQYLKDKNKLVEIEY